MKKLDELLFDKHPMATLAAIIFAVALFVMVSGSPTAQAHDMCRFTNQTSVRLLHDIDADIRQTHMRKAAIKAWVLWRKFRDNDSELRQPAWSLWKTIQRNASGDRNLARGMIEGMLILLGEGLSKYKNCGR